MNLNWARIGRFFVLMATLCSLFYATALRAQQDPGPVSPRTPQTAASDQRVTNAPPPSATQTPGIQQSNVSGSNAPKAYITYKTPYEFWLTGLSIVLVISLGMMLCIMAGIGKLTQEFYKAFLILVVVFSALFLIVAGYTDQQTAPVFSLLGTIAGYIFGRSTSPGAADQGTTGDTSQQKEKKPATPADPAPEKKPSPTAEPAPQADSRNPDQPQDKSSARKTTE